MEVTQHQADEIPTTSPGCRKACNRFRRYLKGGAGLRGPPARLGDRNDDAFGLELVPFHTVPLISLFRLTVPPLRGCAGPRVLKNNNGGLSPLFSFTSLRYRVGLFQPGL
jgi:hypothetical protein